MEILAARFAELRPIIDNATHDHLIAVMDEIGTSRVSDEFTQTCVASIQSGKRFRGLLAYFGASLALQRPLDDPDLDLSALAAGLELYQASALAHDDLIDHADTRRGAPTPHVRLAGIHRDRGWEGSATAFGAAGAVLVGDLLFSAAQAAVNSQCSLLAPERAFLLMQRFTTMHAEVGLGQYLDIRAENLPLDVEDNVAISVEDVMEVVLHKSAHYSIVHPAILGAIAGGGSPELIQALDSILTPWGIAFQLRDDDLGIFGDPATTGKPAGDDLREGKRTVLLSLAWSHATVDERRTLLSVLGDEDASDEAIAQCATIIEERGRRAHESLIDSLVKEGHRGFDAYPFTEDQRRNLTELAEIVTARTA